MHVILGATGRVGGATAAELVRRGEPVRAVVRASSRTDGLAGCEIRVADLQDGDALARAMAGAATVLLICPPGQRVDGTVEALAEAVERARPALVLAISDYGAHLDRGTGITLAFHHLEARLRRTGAPLILVRSAEHMQNWARVLRPALTGGVLPTMHRPRSKRFPTVSAPDVGAISAELLVEGWTGAGARVVHVEGPRRPTAGDVADAVAGLCGRSVVAAELPRPEWIPRLVASGASPWAAELTAELYDAHNAGLIDVEPGCADVRRGATDLDAALAPMVRAAQG